MLEKSQPCIMVYIFSHKIYTFKIQALAHFDKCLRIHNYYSIKLCTIELNKLTLKAELTLAIEGGQLHWSRYEDASCFIPPNETAALISYIFVRIRCLGWCATNWAQVQGHQHNLWPNCISDAWIYCDHGSTQRFGVYCSCLLISLAVPGYRFIWMWMDLASMLAHLCRRQM